MGKVLYGEGIQNSGFLWEQLIGRECKYLDLGDGLVCKESLNCALEYYTLKKEDCMPL
jgi:hypothetical protein